MANRLVSVDENYIFPTPLEARLSASFVTDANVAAQINGAQTGPAIDARITTQATPLVEPIVADYIASQPAVVDAAAAAVDANPTIAELQTGKSNVGHTHTQVENGPGIVRLNSSGGLQHLVNGVVVTEFDSGGTLSKGTVGKIARGTKEVRFDAVGRLQYYDTTTGTVLFQISPNGQVTIGAVPWERIVGAPTTTEWSSITGIPEGLEVSDVDGPLGPLTALLSHANTRTVPLFFIGSSTTRRDYPKNVVNRLAAAYPSGGAEYGTVYADVALGSKHTGPGVAGYNAGRGGKVSGDYIDQIILGNIALTQPVAVFHGIGSNDWANNVNPATYEANVRSAIASIDAVLTKPHVHILMQQHTRVGTRTYAWDEYGAAMRRIADDADNRVYIDLGPAIDTLDPLGTDPFIMGAGDGTHLNADGEAALGELMARALGIPGGTGEPRGNTDTGAQDITSLVVADAISSGTITFQHKNGWNAITMHNVKLAKAGNVNLFPNNNPTLKPWAPGVDGISAGEANENLALGSAGTDSRRLNLNYTGGMSVYGGLVDDVVNGTLIWPMNRTMP